MSYIDAVAKHLQNQSVGTVGTDIFKSYMPDNTTGTFYAVLDRGGGQPDKFLPTKEPSFQVFIRSNSYVNGKAAMDAVRDALHQQTNLELEGVYFYFILANSEGGHIGRNDRGLEEFSITFHCRTR